MPALSFQGGWLDKLLSGSKKQTTRSRTTRIKVGDIVNVYNQQRGRIVDKPLRRLTADGMRRDKVREYPNHDYAHFLGKVIIVEVYDMIPAANSIRSTWAKEDGFDNFACADTWFTQQYGNQWDEMPWTVIKWDDWYERYFEPSTE